MGKSLKEYLIALGYWGLIVIAPIVLDTIGIYQLAHDNQFTGIPSWVWFQIAFIFLLIIPFIAFHKLRVKLDERQEEINKLLNARPTINVKQIKKGNACYLQVHNDGAEAIFRTQINLSSDDPKVWNLPQYNGYWKYANKCEARILRGQDDLLVIAYLSTSRPPGPISQDLEFLYYDPMEDYPKGITTSSHFFGAILTSTDGNSRPLPKKEYKLHITISSSPELKEGIFQKEYILDVDGWKSDISS